MNKETITTGAVVILIAIVALFLFWRTGNAPQNAAVDQKNSTYIIEGQPVTLINGSAETSATSGSAEKVVTQYFGNEATGDFNGDGTPDIAFLLTQDPGGTGTFFYVVVALKTSTGYQGTNAVLLGDRIAPQTTEFKNGMIIVNYAERAQGDPMTAQPSVGVSKYFKIIDGELKEIELKMGEAEARTIAEKTCIKGGEALQEGTYNENSKTWWFDANLNSTKPGCNPACVVSEETKTAEVNWRCTGAIPPKPAATNCLPEQRNVDVCTADYTPVCATVQIQCIKAPCNPIQQTFPNSCNACKNPLVSSYLAGECAE